MPINGSYPILEIIHYFDLLSDLKIKLKAQVLDQQPFANLAEDMSSNSRSTLQLTAIYNSSPSKFKSPC